MKVKYRSSILCALQTVTLALGQPSQLPNATADLTHYVNLFIGTQGTVPGTSFNGGNTFPGPAVPFGAAKPGIDTTEFNQSTDANAGYTPDGNVTAITMLHVSGTGGAPKYGIIPQMPLTSLEGVNLLDNLTYMQPRIGNDTASVGYYKTSLQNGVVAELSATQHAGIFRYSFPSSGEKYVMVDLSHYLPTQDEVAGEQMYSNGMIDVSSDGSKYSGYGVYRGGFNEAPDYTVYFCAAFDSVPSSAKLFSGAYTDPYWPNATNVTATFVDGTSLRAGTPGWSYADRIGALFQFSDSTSTVQSKVAVSWISADKACMFLEEEIPAYDVNATIAAAKTVWNTEVLNKIQVNGTTNQTRLEMFYSALYRTHLLPSNRTGEQPNWTPTNATYDDFYTIWDIFRCLTSLYTLIDPDMWTGAVMTLIDIYEHEMFMPDGRSSNYNGRVQGGSNADNVLADAYVKGLGKGQIDWTKGYAAMVQDAEVVPPNNLDYEDSTGSTKEGRGALPDWLEYGYITPLFARSVSRTVEYSLNDFALSQVARDLAPQDYQKYLNRSAGWQRIWRSNVTSLNFTGFLAPVYANGSIQPYDPTSCGQCEWSAICYEALPWEYSWTVPFDMETLISFMGGPEVTERRLDTMFIPNIKSSGVGSGGNNGVGSTLFNPGNEPR